MIYKDLHGYSPFSTTDKSLFQLKIIKQSNKRITGIITGCILKISRNRVLSFKNPGWIRLLTNRLMIGKMTQIENEISQNSTTKRKNYMTNLKQNIIRLIKEDFKSWSKISAT